jgi:hypothetical protein
MQDLDNTDAELKPTQVQVPYYYPYTRAHGKTEPHSRLDTVRAAEVALWQNKQTMSTVFYK